MRGHHHHIGDSVIKRQHFLIFREYVFSMEFWGLPLWPDGLARLHAAPDDKAVAIAAIRVGAAGVPTPFVQWDDTPAVSSDFVVVGSYLLSPPHADNPELDSLRAEFNRAAERELPNLLEMLLELPSLPRRIRELLRSYTQREDERPMPLDTIADAA